MNVDKMKQLAAAAHAIEKKGLAAKIDNISTIRMHTYGAPWYRGECGYAACLCGTAAALFQPEAWGAYLKSAEEDPLHQAPIFDFHDKRMSLFAMVRDELDISCLLANHLFVENSELDAQSAIGELESVTDAYEAGGDEGVEQWLEEVEADNEDDWDD